MSALLKTCCQMSISFKEFGEGIILSTPYVVQYRKIVEHLAKFSVIIMR